MTTQASNSVEHEHTWIPLGFIPVDGGYGITPAEVCSVCRAVRYAPESPHFGEAVEGKRVQP